MATRGMMYWLAVAARQLRDEAGRKQVHIAAEIDRDQSVVARFERHETTPHEVDTLIAGYAADLDLSPIDIWKRAIQLWEAQTEPATAIDDAADAIAETPPGGEENPEAGRRATG